MAANMETQRDEVIAEDTAKKEKPKPDSTPRPTALAKKASKIVHRGEAKITSVDKKESEREGLLQRTKSAVKRAMSRRGDTKNARKPEG